MGGGIASRHSGHGSGLAQKLHAFRDGLNGARHDLCAVHAVGHDGRWQVVRRAGDQWTEPKGLPMALVNTGNVPYVDKTFEIYYE